MGTSHRSSRAMLAAPSCHTKPPGTVNHPVHTAQQTLVVCMLASTENNIHKVKNCCIAIQDLHRNVRRLDSV
jgi:hypothetical protein